MLCGTLVSSSGGRILPPKSVGSHGPSTFHPACTASPAACATRAWVHPCAYNAAMRAPAGRSGAVPHAEMCECQMAIMMSRSVGGVAGSSSGGGIRGGSVARRRRPASRGPWLPGGPEAARRTPLLDPPVPGLGTSASGRGVPLGAAVAEAGRRDLAGPVLRGRPDAGGSISACSCLPVALAGCERDRLAA